jgi:hypothetical protein
MTNEPTANFHPLRRLPFAQHPEREENASGSLADG